MQKPQEVVEISSWDPFGGPKPYPVGARDKSLVFCSNTQGLSFLRPNHRYLYKLSNARYPEQYWVEIFCHRFGELIGVDVPPAHVAIDSNSGNCGALIEWFLYSSADEAGAGSFFGSKSQIVESIMFRLQQMRQNKFSTSKQVERLVAAGEYFQASIPDFNRKTGAQHNFRFAQRICNILGIEESVAWWTKALTFDALVGNTDRHQDNWGIIFEGGSPKRLTPVFDNGTSMGHEILTENIAGFTHERIGYYIGRGRHHLRYSGIDPVKIPHLESVKFLNDKFGNRVLDIVRDLLSFDIDNVRNILEELVSFNVPIPITEERAIFMTNLVNARKNELERSLERL